MIPHHIDIQIVGDRLAGATTRLMATLHVERMCETECDKAADEMVPVFMTALESAHAQTAMAWHECIIALGAWAEFRMRLTPNVELSGGL